MSDIEEVERAEARMIEAKNALLGDVERRESIDRDNHARLIAKWKKAEANFLSILSQLDR
jgi:hypothetical protein